MVVTLKKMAEISGRFFVDVEHFIPYGCMGCQEKNSAVALSQPLPKGEVSV
jgi:hypothetical protein